jgi:hypothetical protein
MEELGRFLGQQPGLGDQCVEGRGDRADRDHAQTAPVFLIGLRRAGAAFQHLRGGDALGVGQRRVDDQSAAQGDREHHAEDAADGGHGDRGPVGEAGPPADHHQAGQHEDDRRQRARRRSNGLDDIVLEDVRIREQAQHRHRDDRGGNRGGESQAGAKAEIDVGGSEDDGDGAAENDRAQRQLAHRVRLSSHSRLPSDEAAARPGSNGEPSRDRRVSASNLRPGRFPDRRGHVYPQPTP